MKKNIVFKFFGAFVALALLLASCEKEAPVKLPGQIDTWDLSDVTSSSVTLRGIVVAQGDGYSEYGVCWSKTTMPTVETASKAVAEVTGAVYKVNVTGLDYFTTYYVRAFAKTNAGVYEYGNETMFTTQAILPTVTIAASATSILDKTASVAGTVTNDGKSAVTERGICWGTATNPTVDKTNVKVGAGLGDFTGAISGLDPGVKYYARAFAKNAIGVAYSSEITFTTTSYPAALYMTGSGVGTDAENWNWAGPLQLVPVNGHPEMFWKIVWMKGTGEFKFAPQAAWSGGDFGKTGDAVAGVYAKGGDNIPAPATAGYYMVVVNLEKNTVEVAEPIIYGMGNAFGGWDGGQAEDLFTVDNANKVIKFNNLVASGDLRMYVKATTLACDWWQAEFVVINGKIEFRGTGGDQAAQPVTAGQNVSLNFFDGTGTIN
jgi:hypothetical protein